MTKSESVKHVVQYLASAEYGDTITHNRLAEIAGVREGSEAYRNIMARVQKKMLDHGHAVENVRGVGYRVLDPDDYSGVSVRLAVSGARRIDRGVKVLRNAPLQDMSADGRARYNTVNDRMMILQAAVTGAKVEITMLESKRKNPLLNFGK